MSDAAEFEPPPPFDPGDLRAPALRRLHAYWAGKAAGRDMPARADIDPVEIPWALRYLSLIDVEPGGEFRFRLDAVGTAEFFKRDMTGLTLSDYPFPDRARFMRAGYAHVARQRTPLHAVRDFAIEFRRWRYEILLLPLSEPDRPVDIIMSMLQIFDEVRV